MDIEIDLVRDWTAHLRERLTRLGGVLPDNPTPANVTKAFFNAALRRVAERPRNVVSPEGGVAVPPEHQVGYQRFIEAVKRGESLTPYQSGGLDKHDGLDGLLFDWRIQHFHLGEGPHPRRPHLVARTKPLLYAIVTEDVVYEIVVKPHGEWHCIELLSIVESNWPALLAHAKVEFVGVNAAKTDAEVALLRGSQINGAVQLPSGDVYQMMGSGIALSGEAFSANRAMIQSLNILKGVEKLVVAEPENLAALLAGDGETPGKAVIELFIDAEAVQLREKTTNMVIANLNEDDQLRLFGNQLAASARRLGLSG